MDGYVRVGVFLAFVGPWCAVTALSQDAPAASSSGNTVSRLAGVRVEAHYDNGVGTSDAASQGAVEGALLKDIAVLRPGEMLEAVPGLVVAQHSGEGKANQYFLRGYNLDHGTDFAVAVDGVPINLPTNGHAQGYADANFLIPELVDRIDYEKGPYYASAGDFASAGSAHVEYKRTLPSPMLQVTTGQNGYRRGLWAQSFALSDTSDPLAPHLLVALDGTEDDGPWKQPERLRKANVLLRLVKGSENYGWALDAVAYSARWNSTDQVPVGSIRDGSICRFCAIDPSDGGRTARSIVSWRWKASDQDGYLEASAFAQHYRLRLWSNFSFFLNNPVHGDQLGQSDRRNVFGGAVAKGWYTELFGRATTVEAGLQLRHDDIDVALDATRMRVPLERLTDDQVRLEDAGAYVQAVISWSDWFRSTLGVRVQDLRQRLDSRTYAANSGSAQGNKVMPKLALIFGPWEKTEFFVNAGLGYHSNDARGVVNRFDASTGDPVVRAPALSGSRGQEVGVRTELIPGLQSSLGLWHMTSASELVYSADSASTEIEGASMRRGVEWNNHMVVSRHLLLDADLALTKARYSHAGENGAQGRYIPNAVDRVASLGLTVREIGAWTGDIKTVYLSGYPTNQNGSLRGGPSIVTNMRVSRRLGQRASLSLDVLNLFDRRYDEIVYAQEYKVTPETPAVAEGATAHPGQPRQFRLTLSLVL